MEDFIELIGQVGAPIAGALAAGLFVFIILRQILNGLVDDMEQLTLFCKMLETRCTTMSNEMLKIDLLVSQALDLPPDLERVSRAENFVEDGKVDARRD
jgi:hypothetical protein|tara:strand:- start:219 stop:515 length:297 start_codon:yes stop_codon:yes gene_type:complete